MKIKTSKRRVKTSELFAQCGDCDENLEFTGKVLPRNPPLYVYRCPKCKEEIELPEIYPRLVYEEENGDN